MIDAAGKWFNLKKNYSPQSDEISVSEKLGNRVQAWIRMKSFPFPTVHSPQFHPRTRNEPNYPFCKTQGMAALFNMPISAISLSKQLSRKLNVSNFPSQPPERSSCIYETLYLSKNNGSDNESKSAQSGLLRSEPLNYSPIHFESGFRNFQTLIAFCSFSPSRIE